MELINHVTEGIRGPLLALHVCRGNWSQKEEVLLQGSHDGLVPYLRKMKVDQFVLEYATPRAGSVKVLKDLTNHVQLGLGAVNPRTTEIESPEEIIRRAREAAEVLGPERIFLNPDCGFGTFAERPVATATVAYQKLRAPGRGGPVDAVGIEFIPLSRLSCSQEQPSPSPAGRAGKFLSPRINDPKIPCVNEPSFSLRF